MTKLTKTEFHQYRSCSKSLWLQRNRPGAIQWPPITRAEQARLREGQEVERVSSEFVSTMFSGTITPQVTLETPELLARLDFLHDGGAGTIDIIEVKAGTKVQDGKDPVHIIDASFQVLVAERAGKFVDRTFIVHLDGNYRRVGDLDAKAMYTAVDVTDQVRELLKTLTAEIDGAAAFLALPAIDENGCDCRFKGANKHCVAFAHFNPGIPSDSAHKLPRISAKKLSEWDGAFGLDQIDPSGLSETQKLVHQAYLNGPVIDVAGIRKFLETMQYPLYFYDYETTGPAIPPVGGYRPFQALPVQFSLHRLSADGELQHFEWLADAHGKQLELVERLEELIGSAGSAVSWNKGYENGCNNRLAAMFPSKADFLGNLNDRTVDLEDPFKKHYVDWRFGGRTSIKKVLPALCPELSYDELEVHEGTGAVEAWQRMVDADDAPEREMLRRQLLEYCKLDTLAMVEIHAFLRRVVDAA